MLPGEPRRVTYLPAGSAGATSYIGLLRAALQAEGWETQLASGSDLWRIGRDRSCAVVHLHWLEFIASSDGHGGLGLLRTLWRQLRLLAGLIWLRVRGIGIVWTVHNLRPHEPVRPVLERYLSWAVLRLCDRAIAHSDYARTRIDEAYGHADKVTVIPHGNYTGVYPTAPSPLDPRQRLGIPESAFVFLAFGQIRPYKQVVELVQAFGELPGDHLRLLVVGRPVVRSEAERLRAAAAIDRRVILDLREVADTEVAELHAASDAAVIAYRDVFSSGALLLALSFGLPVVAPAHGTAAEVSTPPALEVFAVGGLVGALSRMSAAQPAGPARRQAALAGAERYPWSELGRATAALYAQVLA